MSRGGHNHCGDYTRSQLFRAGAAQAGADNARKTRAVIDAVRSVLEALSAARTGVTCASCTSPRSKTSRPE